MNTANNNYDNNDNDTNSSSNNNNNKHNSSSSNNDHPESVRQAHRVGRAAAVAQRPEPAGELP